MLHIPPQHFCHGAKRRQPMFGKFLVFRVHYLFCLEIFLIFRNEVYFGFENALLPSI
jgi:hypothetical protein